MKERVRIMLGNQEIVKRYLGNRLLWNSVPELFETLLGNGAVFMVYDDGILFTMPRKIKSYSEIKGVRVGRQKVPFIFKSERFKKDLVFSKYIFISDKEAGLKAYLGLDKRTLISGEDIGFYV